MDNSLTQPTLPDKCGIRVTSSTDVNNKESSNETITKKAAIAATNAVVNSTNENQQPFSADFDPTQFTFDAEDANVKVEPITDN